jgi:hypothetical protein
MVNDHERAPAASQQYRGIGILMGVEATTLAVASFLHLAGYVRGHAKPYTSTGAGIAEAVLCVALAWGASAMLRPTAGSRSIAIGTTAVTIAGFGYGLSVTTQGGDLPDITYHAAMLPVLLSTLILILRTRRGDPEGDATPVPSGRGVSGSLG